MVVINEYLEESGVLQDQKVIQYNNIINTMARELLLPCIKDMFRIFLCNIIHGLITTVLKVHPVLNWLALIIYVIYMLLLILSIKNRTRATPFAVFVLLAMIVNILFTATTIYCQMRYMLYNTALFYQAMFIMMIEIYRTHKEI
jgi:hypothetical protein